MVPFWLWYRTMSVLSFCCVTQNPIRARNVGWNCTPTPQCHTFGFYDDPATERKFCASHSSTTIPWKKGSPLHILGPFDHRQGMEVSVHDFHTVVPLLQLSWARCIWNVHDPHRIRVTMKHCIVACCIRFVATFSFVLFSHCHAKEVFLTRCNSILSSIVLMA